MTINRFVVLFLLSVFTTSKVMAQKNKTTIEVQPITESSIKKWRTNVYTFGSWSSIKHGSLWTANNNTGEGNSDCYFSLAELGISTDIYKDRGLFIEGNLGYSYGSLAYSRSLFSSSNVSTHWITLDANLSHTLLLDGLFYGGVKSSLFLNCTVNNTDDYSFEGFYDDCFNRVTFTPYSGFRLRFQYVKFDVRIGGHIVHYFNVNKIAYHNMHKTYLDGMYFEVRLGVRLFSTSNPSRPVNSLF